jgi:DNA-directed RNA polymerase subunit omega
MARVSIEDCLDYIENRFALVSVAADRARQLMEGAEPLLKTKNKEAVTALREIAEGMIVAKDTTPGGAPNRG